jgi:hypothetical protein
MFADMRSLPHVAKTRRFRNRNGNSAGGQRRRSVGIASLHDERADFLCDISLVGTMRIRSCRPVSSRKLRTRRPPIGWAGAYEKVCQDGRLQFECAVFGDSTFYSCFVSVPFCPRGGTCQILISSGVKLSACVPRSGASAVRVSSSNGPGYPQTRRLPRAFTFLDDREIETTRSRGSFEYPFAIAYPPPLSSENRI